jgi:hypothetical protein
MADRPSSRRTVLAAVLAVALVPGAARADLVWELVSAWNASGLEAPIDRLAAEGYTVQAVVLEADQPTVLLAREGWSRRPRAASYRVLGREQADAVAALAAEGWTLHRSGQGRDGRAVVVLARAAGSDAPQRADVTLRSVLANGDAAAVGATLGPHYAAGHRVVAALGGAGKEADWLLVGRGEEAGGPAEVGSREVRVVADKGSGPLATKLGELAGQGFAVDAVWTRGGGGFLAAGTKEVLAAVSRPGGSDRPVAHTRLDLGDEPSSTGSLVAVARYGSKLLFAVRDARSNDYDTQEVLLPLDGEGKPLPAWQRDNELRERLRSYAWSPIERAWFTWDAGRVASLVVLERETPITPSSTRASREEAAVPGVPSGATALPADGGDPAKAWWAVVEAIRKKDLKAAKARWTGEKLTRWNENVARFKAPFGMGFSEKELFAGEADDLPTDPRILGGWERGDEALVRIEGTVDGARAVSDLSLRREGGVWKIADETSWRALP